MAARRVSELDIDALRDREFFPSPSAWEDQVLYFLLVDRFSRGDESEPFRPEDAGNAVRTDEEAARWREAGRRWVGGTLRGLKSRIGYLERSGSRPSGSARSSGRSRSSRPTTATGSRTSSRWTRTSGPPTSCATWWPMRTSTASA